MTRPPVPQNPLTPGMGLVDDDSTSETETNVTTPEADEEALFLNGGGSPFSKHFNNRSLDEPEEIWEELEDDSISELPPFLRRRSSTRSSLTIKPSSQGHAAKEPPNESTSLLSRAGTGRSYRDTGRRRSRHLSGSYDPGRRKRSTSSQEALGGWWKMKRWWEGKDSKGKSRDNGNGNDNGNGA